MMAVAGVVMSTDLLTFISLRKDVVCFQHFELVGIGVLSALVTEDVGKPDALLAKGEKGERLITICWIYCIVHCYLLGGGYVLLGVTNFLALQK